MPTGRRKSGNPTVAPRNPAAQSTLSFNSKHAGITKPSAQHQAPKKAISDVPEATLDKAVKDGSISHVEVRESELEPEVTEVKVPIREQVKPVKDEAELRAEKVTDSQIRRYWQAEEDSRKAPRVHQESLTTHEKILRHFDLSSQYGPCIGIPRLKRWKRADVLGLHPPVEVLAVLLREQKANKGSDKGTMAYIDELAGGRVILME